MGYDIMEAKIFIQERCMPEYNFDLFMQGFGRPHEYTNPLVKKKRRPLSATIPTHNLNETI